MYLITVIHWKWNWPAVETGHSPRSWVGLWSPQKTQLGWIPLLFCLALAQELTHHHLEREREKEKGGHSMRIKRRKTGFTVSCAPNANVMKGQVTQMYDGVIESQLWNFTARLSNTDRLRSRLCRWSKAVGGWAYQAPCLWSQSFLHLGCLYPLSRLATSASAFSEGSANTAGPHAAPSDAPAAIPGLEVCGCENGAESFSTCETVILRDDINTNPLSV